MRICLTVLLVAVMVSTVGCYWQKDQRIELKEEIRSDSLASNLVVRPVGQVLGAIVGEGIQIEEVKTGIGKGGFMQVFVSGFNNSSGTKRFEYRVEWFDGDGVVINSTSSTWLPVSATGKSSFNFKAVAPSKDAVDFKIDTRKQG